MNDLLALREAVAEAVYDAWRLGRYPTQTPMWHELEADSRPTFTPETNRIMEVIDRHLESHLNVAQGDTCAELRDRTEDIEGVRLTLPDGSDLWLHTTNQVNDWLMGNEGLFRGGEATS